MAQRNVGVDCLYIAIVLLFLPRSLNILFRNLYFMNLILRTKYTLSILSLYTSASTRQQPLAYQSGTTKNLELSHPANTVNWDMGFYSFNHRTRSFYSQTVCSLASNIAILSHNIAILIGRLLEQFATDANKLQVGN